MMQGHQNHSSSRDNIAVILSIVCILLAFAVINSNSFFVPHITGDQRVYAGIAMKLDQEGLKEYNVKRIGTRGDRGLVRFFYSKDEKGDLLRQLESEGTFFYNQPLFHAPPLFPYLIMFSHRLFAQGKPYYVVSSHTEDISKREKLSVQFYCCFVPIAGGLLLLIGCFFIGRYLFSDVVGILSALLLAISPIHILASQRIWAGTTLSFLVIFTILFFYLYMKRNKLIFIIISSIFFAMALLTKNSALITAIPILYCYYLYKKEISGGFAKRYSHLALYFIIIFLLTLPWNKAMVQVFGAPFFAPSQEGISRTHEWFAFLNERPWYTYIAGIPFQVPLFLLAYFSMAALFFKVKPDKRELFLSIWFLSYLLFLMYHINKNEMLGPDHRYMLPAYPALAILSSNCLNNVRIFINKRTNAIIGNSGVALILILCIIWSLKITFAYINVDSITVLLDYRW